MSAVWDGTDSSGNAAPTGQYVAVVNAISDNNASGNSWTLLDDIPLPTVEQISANVVPMVDNDNKGVKTPQYVRATGLNNPMAFLASAQNQTARVTLNLPPSMDRSTPFTVIGVNGTLSNPVFGPVTFIPTFLGNQTFTFTFTPQISISEIGTVEWYGTTDAKTYNPLYYLGETDSPIYAVLQSPLAPQQRPRIDVLDYATKAANGAMDADTVRADMTNYVYFESGFEYNTTLGGNTVHTAQNPDGSNMRLTVSNFIHFDSLTNNPRGNCQDFSNLWQVSCAALGVPAHVLRINGYEEKRPPPEELLIGIHTRPVQSIGLLTPSQTYKLFFHQVGYESVAKVFDPTYRLQIDFNWILPVDMTLTDYKENLLRTEDDQGRPVENVWNLQSPTRPVLVR